MPRGTAFRLGARISDRIAAEAGKVWTPVDFLDLGPRAAIDKSLQRLTAEGKVSRVSRGLYYRPRTNRLTGKATTPDVRAIVDAITRRSHSRIIIDGMTAANDLGLTTAVPARNTFVTDVRLAPIQIGKQRIAFQTVAPKRLYWAGRPAMRVVQALHWLRDLLDSGDAQLLRRLRAILADRTHGYLIRDDLRQGMAMLPVWMQRTVRELLDSPPHAGATRHRRQAQRRKRSV